MTDASQLKSHLLHTWPVLFAQHGNFTHVQRQAIPAILAGQNTLIIAATAAGKTEAAIAPLLERHLYDPAPHSPSTLRILYLCPTRALVRNLYERLKLPLERLKIELSMKSGDTGPVSLTQPPTVLITTPESTDSLLTRGARLFTSVRAIVIDEVHLFDNTPRGDHLRCLLRRIESIQRYHAEQSGQPIGLPLQRVALSATIADPSGVAERYLVQGERRAKSGDQRPEVGDSEIGRLDRGQEEMPYTIVEVAGSRRLWADIVPMHGLGDLVNALTVRASQYANHNSQSAIRNSTRPPRKSLLFCNTRNEVEQVAAYLRQRLPFDAEIFVHYSNLDSTLRQEIEDRFAEAPVAICVCTSTLELGIDIGTIDDVALIGPSPTLASFLQRIGRGGRRRSEMRVLCLARSPMEELHFQAMIEVVEGKQVEGERGRRGEGGKGLQHENSRMREGDWQFTPYHFRPSVLVQQVFSILKQSPTAAIRLADLRRVAPMAIGDNDLRAILGELTINRYLQLGRPGEWKAASALNDLIDEHEIYSNIGSDPLKAVIVDAYSGRTIAQSGKFRLEGEWLMMGGKVLEVVWRDRYRIGVRELPQQPADQELRFVTQPFAVSFDLSQAVARHLKIAPNRLCLLHGDTGSWLFHFWGDLYGKLLAKVLEVYFQQVDETAIVTSTNAHCLRIPTSLSQLPAWDEAVVARQLRVLIPGLEPFLELGRFHPLLPADLADRTVVDLCDLERFEALYQTAAITESSAGQHEQLIKLIG